jgi:hypothetical protein
VYICLHEADLVISVVVVIFAASSFSYRYESKFNNLKIIVAKSDWFFPLRYELDTIACGYGIVLFMENRICTRCGLEKPYSFFFRVKVASKICSDCAKESYRESQRASKQRGRDDAKRNDGSMEKYRLRKIWQEMIRRCGDYKHRWYHRYGGRGIKVCDRWLNSFEDFLVDMGRVHPSILLKEKTIMPVTLLKIAFGRHTKNNAGIDQVMYGLHTRVFQCLLLIGQKR